MTLEIVLVLAILGAAIVLFSTERLPVDLVALLVLSALLLSGILSPEQAIAGFSNPATVTVAAMFVLSAKRGAARVVRQSEGRRGVQRYRRSAVWWCLGAAKLLRASPND